MIGFFKKAFSPKPGHATSGFFGDFATWEEARKEAGGYEEPLILARTASAMRQIQSGRGVFERDSVLLSRPEPPWPLLTCLLHAAFSSQHRLSVLDFGGALGSSFYQGKPFLEGIPNLTWAVVEQSHYVETGRREFSQPPVCFYVKAREAHAAHQPNLLLLSSVLPYLPDPWASLDELLALKIRFLVIDRLPLLEKERDRLTVQRVPPEIYPASYPAWFFGRSRLLSICSRHGYRELAEWPCADDWNPEGDKARFVGLFLERA